MKSTYRTLMSLGLAALAPLASAQDTPPAPAAAPTAATATATPSPQEIKEAFSYFMGYRFGMQLATDGIEVGDLDQATFFKALADSLGGTPDPAMEEKLGPAMQAFVATLQQRAETKAAANQEAGQKFLEENGQKDGVVTTNSGLQYKVIKESRGMRYNEKVHGKAAECSITYEGRLIDGKVFDASKEPVPMPINGTIPGFAEALRLMPVGSTYELYIPAELAYGQQGAGIIPPNATLIFTVTLEDIKAGRGRTPGNPIELTPEMMQQLQQQGLQPVSN